MARRMPEITIGDVYDVMQQQVRVPVATRLTSLGKVEMWYNPRKDVLCVESDNTSEQFSCDSFAEVERAVEVFNEKVSLL